MIRPKRIYHPSAIDRNIQPIRISFINARIRSLYRKTTKWTIAV